MYRLILVASSIIALTSQASAIDASANRKALDEYLLGVPGAQSGIVESVNGDLGAISGSGNTIYSIRFRGYPVRPPKPFKMTNLLVVDPDNHVKLLNDEGELKKYFVASLKPLKETDQFRMAIEAWLRVAALLQDTYYRFSFDPTSLRTKSEGDKQFVTARSVVREGGRGEIVATVEIDKRGRIIDIKTRYDLIPAERPASAKP